MRLKTRSTKVLKKKPRDKIDYAGRRKEGKCARRWKIVCKRTFVFGKAAAGTN